MQMVIIHHWGEGMLNTLNNINKELCDLDCPDDDGADDETINRNIMIVSLIMSGVLLEYSIYMC
ncbi:hypothetical protein AWC35_14265 [Gibbsiella quercinecans]|uniref:Uncharacterized protein n=1 Tax=Gibbsiella quercinecans TaxID=929813 RepID=A0A250B2E8_9GAMM|nr:hypothetical protein AWC35_14265 [Gibbsiella quercinecans]RLM02696.1 hypothetical protein BIY31_23180 [Gibbsiella quercinecans]RLM03057.1 hypothetical protein BIY30_22760 [Gibbsiella quercinecans]